MRIKKHPVGCVILLMEGLRHICIRKRKVFLWFQVAVLSHDAVGIKECFGISAEEYQNARNSFFIEDVTDIRGQRCEQASREK